LEATGWVGPARAGLLMPVRILIADDHSLSAAGLAAALEVAAGIEVVGVARNGIEAIAKVKALKPDCAVLDLTMPGANGLEVFIEARRWAPETRFVVVTGNHLPAVFRELVEAGIDGVLMKNESPEELIEGVLAVSRGEKRFSPTVREALDAAVERAKLTARELEILHGIARGLSNNQMAERFAISAKTIDSHRTSLMRKLAVHSTAALLVRAMRLGLIDV